MKIMIFGCGKIFKEQYSRFIVPQLMKNQSEIKVHLVLVDPNVKGCLKNDDLFSQKDVLLENLQKIIILSPPSEHFCNVDTLRELYIDNKSKLPQIYIEKPVFLDNQKDKWLNILDDNPWLQRKIFYIDHYRYKDAINFFITQKIEFKKLIGDVKEVTFISLEKKRFWNSKAFSQGYLLEHGCHFFAMFNQLFPEYSEINLVPHSLDQWKAWVQRCRPPKCCQDSAVLCFLEPSYNGEKLDLERITIVIGKGMIDKKYFLIDGTEGSVQILFNEEKILLKSPKIEEIIHLNETKESYQNVVESILYDECDVAPHLCLDKGISIQKKIIEIKSHLKNSYSEYSVGEVPSEIQAVLKL